MEEEDFEYSNVGGRCNFWNMSHFLESLGLGGCLPVELVGA